MPGGGGVFAAHDNLGASQIVFNNCTFVLNKDIGIEADANTGVFRGQGSALFSSSIVLDEEPGFAGEGSAQFYYSNVMYEVAGETNSQEDPGFFGTDSTWFVLSGDSPCIDSGDPGLAADPDETQNDRGWMYYPQNASLGIITDSLEATLWDDEVAYREIQYENVTEAPIYLSIMDKWEAEEPAFSYNINEITGAEKATGAALIDSCYFIAGTDSAGENKIYCLDPNFELAGEFDQPGDPSGDGYLDIAAGGGSVMFGSRANTVYEFTIDGEFGDRYNGPRDIENYNALAVDFHNPLSQIDFYIAGEEGKILRTDSDLWLQAEIEIGAPVLAMAVKWNSRALYIITEPSDFTSSLNQQRESICCRFYILMIK